MKDTVTVHTCDAKKGRPYLLGENPTCPGCAEQANREFKRHKQDREAYQHMEAISAIAEHKNLDQQLLDTFAAAALTGVLAYTGSNQIVASVSQLAYDYAEAMLLERNRRIQMRACEAAKKMSPDDSSLGDSKLHSVPKTEEPGPLDK